MSQRLLASILGIALIGSFLIQPARAKEYPTRPIEILCPYAPGSSMDIVSQDRCRYGPEIPGTEHGRGE